MNTKYIIIFVLLILIILFIQKIVKKCKKPEFFDLNPTFNPDDFFLEYKGNLSGTTDVNIDNFESNVSLNTKKLCIGDTCIDNTNLDFLDTLAKKTDTDLSIGTEQVHESDFEHLNKFTKQGLIVPFYYKQASELENLPNYWKQCNGENGTPDLRGRVLVGTSDGSMGGAAMDVTVDPAQPDNPTYTISTAIGNNGIVLTQGQIPSHIHDVTLGQSTPTITPTGWAAGPYLGDSIPGGGGFDGGNNAFRQRQFNANPLPPHTHSVTLDPTGGGQSHSNYQPGRGVYYIIYIP
jgi:microcystin-dependent protein